MSPPTIVRDKVGTCSDQSKPKVVSTAVVQLDYQLLRTDMSILIFSQWNSQLNTTKRIELNDIISYDVTDRVGICHHIFNVDTPLGHAPVIKSRPNPQPYWGQLRRSTIDLPTLLNKASYCISVCCSWFLQIWPVAKQLCSEKLECTINDCTPCTTHCRNVP